MSPDCAVVEPTDAVVEPTGVGRRLLAARVVAVATVVLAAGCMAVGFRATDVQRAAAEVWASTLPRGSHGIPVFSPRQVPEQFVRFVAERVPAHDPVQYVAPGVDLCRDIGTPARYYGPVFWAQYRLAPRPTACGARWRVYLGTPPPPSVPARDRWSPTFAVGRVR